MKIKRTKFLTGWLIQKFAPMKIIRYTVVSVLLYMLKVTVQYAFPAALLVSFNL